MRRRLERMSTSSVQILMGRFGVGFYSLWSVCGKFGSLQKQKEVWTERQMTHSLNLVGNGWDSIGKMAKINS
jgi:HSP90 family molecular chaperone